MLQHSYKLNNDMYDTGAVRVQQEKKKNTRQKIQYTQQLWANLRRRRDRDGRNSVSHARTFNFQWVRTIRLFRGTYIQTISAVPFTTLYQFSLYYFFFSPFFF